MDYPYAHQAPADSLPASVVRTVIAALREKRWSDVAALVDPQDLSVFAQAEVDELRRIESGSSMVDKLRAKSALSPHALEHFALQEAARMQEVRARFSLAYGENIDLGALAELAPETLLVRWLAASHPSELLRHIAPQADAVPRDVLQAAEEMVAQLQREVLTTEYEGPDRARVTYREWVGPDSAREEAELRSTMLRRTAAGWRIGVDKELMGHAGVWIVVEPEEP